MLSARQQRNLEQIEAHLRHSDSRLAWRFSLFAELVDGDEMPRREIVAPTPWQRVAQLGRQARRGLGRDWRPATLMLLIPAIILAVTCALLVTMAPAHPSLACARPGPGADNAAQPVTGQVAGPLPYCAPPRSSSGHR